MLLARRELFHETQKEGAVFLNQARSETPPQMRGKDALAPCLVVLLGITPACAGKRGPTWEKRSISWDHPRVCGEKPWTPWEKIVLKGSPPRVRGKAQPLFLDDRTEGITPACAGKSFYDLQTLQRYKDHPRVCGEKRSSGGPRRWKWGSPPRVRGKGLRCLLLPDSKRITPACAGKSPKPNPPAQAHKDHPRVCGEKFSGIFKQS